MWVRLGVRRISVPVKGGECTLVGNCMAYAIASIDVNVATVKCFIFANTVASLTLVALEKPHSDIHDAHIWKCQN